MLDQADDGEVQYEDRQKEQINTSVKCKECSCMNI